MTGKFFPTSIGMIVLALVLGLTAQAEVVKVDYNTHLKGSAWQVGKIAHSFREPISFEEWQKSAPAELETLTLFPGYQIPSREVEDNGTLKMVKDDQHIFVARSTFAIPKPVAQVNAAGMIAIDYLKQVDGEIQQTQISANQIIKERKTGRPAIARPSGDWCTAAGSLCIQSQWNYPGFLKGAITGASLMIGAKDNFSLTQSELAPLDLSQAASFQKIAESTTPVTAGVQQSVFYVNQFLRWSKNIVILQANPKDGNQTLVTIYSVTSISSKYYDIDKHMPGLANLLRKMNLTPKEFFLGTSRMNDRSGKNLTAGLPVYSAIVAEAIAAFLSR